MLQFSCFKLYLLYKTLSRLNDLHATMNNVSHKSYYYYYTITITIKSLLTNIEHAINFKPKKEIFYICDFVTLAVQRSEAYSQMKHRCGEKIITAVLNSSDPE